MAKKPKKIDTTSLPDSPIGLLPDGQLNVVDKDAPAFKPTVYNGDGKALTDDDLASIDDEYDFGDPTEGDDEPVDDDD